MDTSRQPCVDLGTGGLWDAIDSVAPFEDAEINREVPEQFTGDFLAHRRGVILDRFPDNRSDVTGDFESLSTEPFTHRLDRVVKSTDRIHAEWWP